MGRLFDRSIAQFSDAITDDFAKNPSMANFAESLWEKYKGLAPRRFQSKFLTSENTETATSFLWEMWLACEFLDNGFTVKKVSDKGPDICLEIDGQKVWVECSIPTRGDCNCPDNPEPHPEPQELHPGQQLRGDAIVVDEKANILRCTSKLIDKKEQHKGWLADGTCKENESFVIALNVCNLDMGIYEKNMPSIMGALYNMGRFCISGSLDSQNRLIYQSQYEHRSSITKQSGSHVSTGFFLNKENKHISGVICCGPLNSTIPMPGGDRISVFCYVRNIHSEQNSDFGFEKFMQTYDYDVTKGEISMR